MALKVLDSATQEFGIISKAPNSKITSVAEETSYDPCIIVTVIDSKSFLLRVAVWDAADSASVLLCLQNRLIGRFIDSVFLCQSFLATSLLNLLSVFGNIVLDLLRIANFAIVAEAQKCLFRLEELFRRFEFLASGALFVTRFIYFLVVKSHPASVSENVQEWLAFNVPARCIAVLGKTGLLAAAALAETERIFKAGHQANMILPPLFQ